MRRAGAPRPTGRHGFTRFPSEALLAKRRASYLAKAKVHEEWRLANPVAAATEDMFIEMGRRLCLDLYGDGSPILGEWAGPNSVPGLDEAD